MMYELTEAEIRHMEKVRSLTPASQGSHDMFMDRLFTVQTEIDHAVAERKAAEEKRNPPPVLPALGAGSETYRGRPDNIHLNSDIITPAPG